MPEYSMFQLETASIPSNILEPRFSPTNKLYHISEKNQDGNTFEPRVPVNFMTNAEYEDSTTPRVCFSTSIDGCLIGTMYKTEDRTLYVHEPASYAKLKTHVVSKDEVPETDISNEVWVLNPVKLKCVGKITVSDPVGTPMLYTYGDNIGEAYKWEWEFVDDK